MQSRYSLTSIHFLLNIISVFQMHIVFLRDKFHSKKYDELLNPEYVKLPTFHRLLRENINNFESTSLSLIEISWIHFRVLLENNNKVSNKKKIS